jgi:two-component sensor histidine kinase
LGPQVCSNVDTVANLIQARDWSASPLGPQETWSPGLRTTLAMLLRAHAQIVLFWGPEFVALYNDAYAPTIGGKHPRALGRPARENWAELWNDLGPMLRRVRETGETISAKDRPFYIERHGYGETTYFDISYSAVPDTDGSNGGVLCIVSETTERILAERRVARSETRFRALVSASVDVLYRMNPDWSELRELDGRGYLEDTQEPRTDWREGYILPEDQPMIQERVAEAIAKLEPFQLEHRVRRKDGSIGWIASRAVPILDDEGKVVEWFGASSDVTERHRAEEHLRLVVHELNHRVKNNLAMVQSIASQTFRNATDVRQAQERFAERLVALAQANDLLTGERWAGASLHGAVAQALEPYQRDPGRTVLRGPDILLTPKTALAMTLAMHELSANAVKYGAWSNDRGVVTVAWQRTEEDGAPRLHLEWREEGGPPVTPPERRGFGSRLIERGLAGELNGQVALWFDPAGLRCTVEAPLPESRI